MFIHILHRYTSKHMCEYTDLERDYIYIYIYFIFIYIYISMIAVYNIVDDNCLNLKRFFSNNGSLSSDTFELWGNVQCIAVLLRL